jgi:HNH endonuclease
MRLRTCDSCGAAHPVTSPCLRCGPPADAAPRRPGTGRPQRRARQRVFDAAGGLCFYCNEPADRGDHIVPWAKGGSDDEHNIVAACHRCNHLKGDQLLAPCPTVAIVGEIGAGKSTLAVALGSHTGWPVLAIDEYRARFRTWTHLLEDLDAAGPAVVESVAIPRGYRLRLIIRCALIVHVVCPEPERQRRIADRAGPTDRFLGRDQAAHVTVPVMSMLADIARSAVRDPRCAVPPARRSMAVRLA